MKKNRGLSLLEKAALFLSAALVFFLNRIKIDSNDTWWHLKTGQWMLEKGEIYTREVFSFPVLDKAYVAYQWLSQILFYKISNETGTNLSYFILIIFFSIAFIALKKIAPSYKFNNTTLTIFTVLSVLIAFRNEVRPHVFGILFSTYFCSLFWGWLSDGRFKRFLWFIPIQILWVNLHGSFLLAPSLMVIFSFFLVLENLVSKKSGSKTTFVPLSDISKLWLISVVLILLSLFNPLGSALLSKSFSMFFDASYLGKHVHEWHGIFEIKWGLWAYLWVLWQVAGWIFLIHARKQARPFYWFLMGLSLSFPIIAIRYIPLSAILSLPILIELIPEREWLKKLGPTPILLLLIFNIWVGLNGYPQTRTIFREPGVGFKWDHVPLAVFEHFKAHNYKGKLLTHYNYGASVIYFAWPNILVNIDSRTELYGSQELRKQELALRSETEMEKYLLENDISFVLMPNIAKVVQNFLDKDPNWVLEKLDYDHFLFVRKDVSIWANDKSNSKEYFSLPMDQECVYIRLQGFCRFSKGCEKECAMSDLKISKSLSLKDPNCIKFTSVCSNADFACTNCKEFCLSYKNYFKKLQKSYKPSLKEPNACLDLIR